MINNGLWKIVKFAYATIIRKLVSEAIDNENSEIDEFVLKVLDSIFEYNE